MEDIARRVLLEVELMNERLMPKAPWVPRSERRADQRETPMVAFCHGLPGVGKSMVIRWIVRLFTEGLGWKHGLEFMCVAFQNRVAHTMGGITLHIVSALRQMNR